MKLFLLAAILEAAAAADLVSRDFRIHIDDGTGAVFSIVDPGATNHMNWISSPEDAPWQPLGSRWGMGFVSGENTSLHRAYWNSPRITSSAKKACTASYTLDDVVITIKRQLDENKVSFTESFTFKNTGNSSLDLASAGTTSFAIYTPFNDHYTNSSDALNNRAHAHVWANGGASAWVRMQQMGGKTRNLGLVVSKGALAGYSVEARDTITSSNTRGVFLLHPSLPVLEPGQEAVLEWTLFWHNDWDDFFAQCASRSTQFVNFDVSSYTLFPGERANITMSGSGVNPSMTVDGTSVDCNEDLCSYVLDAGAPGEKKVQISTTDGNDFLNSTIFLNTVPAYDDVISARTKFIVESQQAPESNSSIGGAYIVYDNQMDKQVTFDTASDRNAGRERVGMGVLLSRWLKRHPDVYAQASLLKYYTFVCTQLQDENGYVLNGPGKTSKRLYNWPWVMQLHLTVASLNFNLTGPVASKTPIERFMLTLENFYSEGGSSLYAIGLPILEGLRALNTSETKDQFERGISFFM